MTKSNPQNRINPNIPIYRIDSDKIEPIQPTTFAEQGLREGRNLQALLKIRINVISPDTLVVAEGNSDGASALCALHNTERPPWMSGVLR